jgi:hypothetical protein
MDEDLSDEALVRQMQGMKQSDLSVLSAALVQESPPAIGGGFGRKRQDVHLATLEGSANDVFWQRLERRGWLAAQDVPGLSDVHGTKIFALLPEGREPIDGLFKKWLAARAAHADAMARINNELCVPFVQNLAAAVKAGGGDGLDIGILGARTLNLIARAAGAKGREGQILDHIANMARDMLASERGTPSTN